jgi:hypothetical protein
MNPDPRASIACAVVAFGCALALVGAVIAFARVAWPRIEGWCARANHPLLRALACAEDARLPDAAKARARELFLAQLDERQRRSWHIRRRFEVVGAGGTRYTISRYRPFNVCTNDASFCVAVTGNVPVYDKLLAQKLLIECNEQMFLARANVRTFSRAWAPVLAAARVRYPQPN